MTNSLRDVLLDPARRPSVVHDLQDLLDHEVSDAGGVSGALVKTGYATVGKLRPGAMPTIIDGLLGQFADALDPFSRDFRSSGGSDFGAYLASRPTEAAEALLQVTDRRAERTGSEAVRKVYTKLRPMGRKNVEAALPRLGTVIDRHVTAADRVA